MMKLNSADVLERFVLLSGVENGAEYLPLCADAAAEIERVERDGCGTESAGPLTAAAAALAFYRYELMQAGSDSGSFTAGDVKIEPSGANIRHAKQLWREAAAAASLCLKDSGFLFERTNP